MSIPVLKDFDIITDVDGTRLWMAKGGPTPLSRAYYAEMMPSGKHHYASVEAPTGEFLWLHRIGGPAQIIGLSHTWYLNGEYFTEIGHTIECAEKGFVHKTDDDIAALLGREEGPAHAGSIIACLKARGVPVDKLEQVLSSAHAAWKIQGRKVPSWIDS